MELIGKNRSWAVIAAALVIAGTVYAARSIEADEPDEPAPSRPSPLATGPHFGDGPSFQIPRVEGRFVHGVTHEEYGEVICEQDANVEVSMDGRVVKVTQQSGSDRLPVQVGEQVEGFHETNSLYLNSELHNPYDAEHILDIPAYEKYRNGGTLPGAVHRDEEGALHWGCEAWLLSGDELPSKEERMERLREKVGDIDEFKSMLDGE